MQDLLMAYAIIKPELRLMLVHNKVSNSSTQLKKRNKNYLYTTFKNKVLVHTGKAEHTPDIKVIKKKMQIKIQRKRKIDERRKTAT